jgi:hypothetical protein
MGGGVKRKHSPFSQIIHGLPVLWPCTETCKATLGSWCGTNRMHGYSCSRLKGMKSMSMKYQKTYRLYKFTFLLLSTVRNVKYGEHNQNGLSTEPAQLLCIILFRSFSILLIVIIARLCTIWQCNDQVHCSQVVPSAIYFRLVLLPREKSLTRFQLKIQWKQEVWPWFTIVMILRFHSVT